MKVLIHPLAEPELAQLPSVEKAAMDHAMEKLEALGARLPFPHQCGVRGARGLRELRPRAGRSPWRAIYRQIADAMVIGAFGPEAEVNRNGFDRAVAAAQRRLDELEEDTKDTRRKR